MTPDPHPTKLERAAVLEVSAKIAHQKQDHVFALDLAREAHHLRMEYEIEQKEKNGTH